MGRFSTEEVKGLLVACHRRCCVCHRFCGVKMEMDHIVQEADGGSGTADNAIPVCFDCHAEIHSYNDRHPKGRKFTAEELKGHKDQWLAICREKPEALLLAARDSDVGPLQAVLNELEFNLVVARHQKDHGCLFKDEQFNRAISEGAIWTIDDALKASINSAYAAMGHANQWIFAALSQHPNAAITGRNANEAATSLREALPKIQDAYTKLQSFMQP